jgi:hypothetical protein
MNAIRKEMEVEHKLTLAMQFKLNAQNTSHEEKENAVWLLKAGFMEEEITKSLKDTFKKAYSYRLNKFLRSAVIPEEDQPWHKHWIKKLDPTQQLLAYLLEANGLFPSGREDRPQHFEWIGKTSIKQRQLQLIHSAKTKHFTLICKVFGECYAFF